MQSSTIVLRSLSVLLGLFFIFVGLIKISSVISKDLHKDLRKEYVKYAKVFPLSEALNFKVPSKWYRRTVGVLEIACGIAMAFVPKHKIKNGANGVLLLLALLAVYSHYMVDDHLERTAPALVFFFMLGGRLGFYQFATRPAFRWTSSIWGLVWQIVLRPVLPKTVAGRYMSLILYLLTVLTTFTTFFQCILKISKNKQQQQQKVLV